MCVISDAAFRTTMCSFVSHGNFFTFSQDAANPEEAKSLEFTVLSFNELMAEATPLSEEDPTHWESFRRKQESPLRQSEG